MSDIDEARAVVESFSEATSLADVDRIVADALGKARAELDELRRAIEAWIRHGEAAPANVTTYDRDIVNHELRQIINPANRSQ